MLANRMMYGITLVELGNKNKNIVVLDADLGKATNSIKFKEVFPERYINCGIAEQNMMGIAAGLSTVGKIPFVSTFAIFASVRAAEQIRNSICYPKLNVKIIGTHAGLETGADGGTHQAIEDIAIMRSMPEMKVLVPSDHVSMNKLVKLMAEEKGPMYLRTGREENRKIYNDENEFYLGGSTTLKEGTDITIMACGSMIYKALEAYEELKKVGISARIIDIYSIKPIDEKTIKKAALETKGIITIEDHNILGGLGSAVAEVVTANIPTRVLKIGVPDQYGRSGSSKDLFDLYGLTVEKIISMSKLLNDNI